MGIKKRDTITHISSIASIERPTVWRCLQELTRALEEGGEVKAASIVDQIGKGLSETAKDLAYRMYSVCEKNKISEEAFAYNTLVSSWYSIIEKAGLGTDNGQMKLST